MSNSLLTFRKAQGNFFDRQIVQNAVGKGVAGAMSRIGSYVRTTAQRSIKPARRMRTSEMPDELKAYYKANPDRERPFVSSNPGETPRTRTKKLKRSIFYAFDPRSKSAVAGPVKFLGSKSEHAPSVLEFGGQSTVEATQPPKKTSKSSSTSSAQLEGLQKARANGKIKTRSTSQTSRQTLIVPVYIEPRPYMRPALNIVRPRIQPEFRNLIRG